MKRAFLVTCFLILNAFTFFTQDSIPRYWIEFKDKGNSSFTFDNPQMFLSDRAIQRRINQFIELDSLDLPISNNYIQSILNSGNFTYWGSSKWMNGIIVKTQDTLALDSIANYPFVVGLNQLKSTIQAKNKTKELDFNSLSLRCHPSGFLSTSSICSFTISFLNFSTF